MPQNPYALLNVPTTANAVAIRDAYRREIRRYHPDKVAELGPELRELAEARAKDINLAYAALRSSAAPTSYDASWEVELPTFEEPVPVERPLTRPAAPAFHATPPAKPSWLRAAYARLRSDDVVFGIVCGMVGLLLLSIVLPEAGHAAQSELPAFRWLFHPVLMLVTLVMYRGLFLMAIGMVLMLEDRPTLWWIVRAAMYVARQVLNAGTMLFLFIAVAVFVGVYQGTGRSEYEWNLLVVSSICVPLGLLGVSVACLRPKRIREVLWLLR